MNAQLKRSPWVAKRRVYQVPMLPYAMTGREDQTLWNSATKGEYA